MQCVSEAEVLGFVRGTLAEAERSQVEQHLDACGECLELVTLAARTSLAARDRAPAAERDGTGALAPGAALGRYEILALLGRGAMGMVYAARDTQLGRRVAIKVVHPSLAHLEHSQIGLLREAQAMARITQPNVLTVYDTGIVDDAVFLAAELVEGDTLDAWLARPRRWRAIVEVFVQAARGLEAAHAAGLVHRDFKPGNMMVGRDGRVRVFDFGVARFIDAASPGRELAGTPLYMSPEQLRGDLADARSDQYAFCVALHEALFGHPARPPSPGKRAPSEAREPARGHAIDRAPAWLRDVVRRGLEPQPARRFAAMRDVIAALERGLGRRRRAAVAGLAALAMSAAATTAALGYARGKDEPLARCPEVEPGGAWDAARRAQLAAAFRATPVPYAEATWQWAERELDRFATRWRAQQRETCLAFEVHTTDDAERHGRRLACLDQHRRVFEAILDRLGEVDRKVIDQTTRLIGALPDVEACARAEAPAWPSEVAATSRFAGHFEGVARVWSLADAGRYEAAAERAAALVRDARTLGFRRAEADASYLAGHVAGYLARYDEAVKQIEAAMWIAESTRYDELVVTAACELLYLVGNRQRRPAEARRYVELARAAAERVGTVAARTRAARAIGNHELAAGHFEVAQTELSRALAWTDTRDPLLAATLMMDLSNVASQRGQHSAAEPLLRRAIDAFARELGEVHPRQAHALNNLGNTLLDLRRFDEAAAAFDRAIAILERALGLDHPDVAQTLGNAVAVHMASGQLDRAAELLLRGIAILERHDPANTLLASSLNNLAEVRRLQGNPEEAERLHTRALALRRQHLAEHHPQVTQSLLSLAALALLRGDVAAARARCDEASRAIAGSDADHRAVRAIVETCRGEVELAAGRPASAAAILERALALHQGAEDPARLADTQFALARALPASDALRAIELARAARAGFATEHALRTPEISQVDAWLRRHER